MVDLPEPDSPTIPRVSPLLTVNETPSTAFTDATCRFKRPAVTFGSMGGKGGSPNIIAEYLTDSGFDVIDTDEIMYVPTEEEKLEAYDLGVKLVKEAKKLEL